jgi:hypothetical protein
MGSVQVLSKYTLKLVFDDSLEALREKSYNNYSNKTDIYDIAEILLKVTLNTIAITLIYVDNLIPRS